MRVLQTCGVYITCILSVCVGILWIRSMVLYACNSCFTRAAHAVTVHNKMCESAQKIHQTMPQSYMDDMAECGDATVTSMEQEDVAWHVIDSECYGPTRPIKKRSMRQMSRAGASKKRSRSALHADGKEFLTHRVAPFSIPLPTGSYWLSSRFGPRSKADGSAGFHRGIDLAANRGTSVYVSRSGIVEYAGYDGGYGKTVVVKHSAYFKTRYAHLDRIFVKIGDTVARGATLGVVGATGHVRKKGGDGSHLHFEIQYKGKRVDPLQFLPDIVS